MHMDPSRSEFQRECDQEEARTLDRAARRMGVSPFSLQRSAALTSADLARIRAWYAQRQPAKEAAREQP